MTRERLQCAHIRHVAIVAIRPIGGTWTLVIRLLYSWPEPPEFPLSLREVAFGVALITPSGRQASCCSISYDLVGAQNQHIMVSAIPRAVASGSVLEMEVMLPLSDLPQSGIHRDSVLPKSSSQMYRKLQSWYETLEAHVPYDLKAVVVRSGLSCTHNPKTSHIAKSVVIEHRLFSHFRSNFETDKHTLSSLAAQIAVWDGRRLWLYHTPSSSLVPLRQWRRRLTPAIAQACVSDGRGILVIKETVIYYPIIRELVLLYDTAPLIACVVESEWCCRTGSGTVTWMSQSGLLWRSILSDTIISLPLAVQGVPRSWGNKHKWIIPAHMWCSWARRIDTPHGNADLRWISVCGVSSAAARSSHDSSSRFNLVLERMCLYTERLQAGSGQLEVLSSMADELCAGRVAMQASEFAGGIVCFCMTTSNLPGPTLCISRECMEAWMAEPASIPLCTTRGDACAYLDQGGHIVLACLKSQSAVSRRVAIPGKHEAFLVLCDRDNSDCPDEEILVGAHPNLLGSAWRPQSSPACVLQKRTGEMHAIHPGKAYLTGCTWSGELLWHLPLPVRAQCLANGFFSTVFVGTTLGIFRVDSKTGTLLKLYAGLAALDITCTLKGASRSLVGRDESSGHLMMSIY